MDTEKLLKDEIDQCISDWSEFSATIVPSEPFEQHDCFDVSISHQSLGENYNFMARVHRRSGGDAEMDYSDDQWTIINKENLFAWMWFEEAARSKIK